MGFKRVASMRDSEQMQGNYTHRGKLPRDRVNGKGTLQEGRVMFLPQSLESEPRSEDWRGNRRLQL